MMDAGMARARGLSQASLAMVQERRGAGLEAWMAEATDSRIAELARFGRGLQDDLMAIQAGLTLEWSNGVTEGQIHSGLNLPAVSKLTKSHNVVMRFGSYTTCVSRCA
jgi:hypothetical protein